MIHLRRYYILGYRTQRDKASLQIIAYYLNEGFPPHLLLTLLISEIKVDDQSLYNDTGLNTDKQQPNYSLFVSKLEGLINKNGLTVQPYHMRRSLSWGRRSAQQTSKNWISPSSMPNKSR